MKRTTWREMPRWRISTSRSSCHSARGWDHGRLSKAAAWSAGGVKTKRTVSKCLVSQREIQCPFGQNLNFPERHCHPRSVKLRGRHVGAADHDGDALARRGLVG